MASIEDQIREHIISEFNASADLSDETRLIQDDVIDSLGIFHMVNFLQDRFGVEVEPEEVTLENFESVSAMAGLVSSKRPA